MHAIERGGGGHALAQAQSHREGAHLTRAGCVGVLTFEVVRDDLRHTGGAADFDHIGHVLRDNAPHWFRLATPSPRVDCEDGGPLAG